MRVFWSAIHARSLKPLTSVLSPWPKGRGETRWRAKADFLLAVNEHYIAIGWTRQADSGHPWVHAIFTRRIRTFARALISR